MTVVVVVGLKRGQLVGVVGQICCKNQPNIKSDAIRTDNDECQITLFFSWQTAQFFL